MSATVSKSVIIRERKTPLFALPVILNSVYGRDETIAKALQAKVANSIVKPFSPTALTARIQAALRVHRPALFVLWELSIDHNRRRVNSPGGY